MHLPTQKDFLPSNRQFLGNCRLVHVPFPVDILCPSASSRGSKNNPSGSGKQASAKRLEPVTSTFRGVRGKPRLARHAVSDPTSAMEERQHSDSAFGSSVDSWRQERCSPG